MTGLPNPGTLTTQAEVLDVYFKVKVDAYNALPEDERTHNRCVEYLHNNRETFSVSSYFEVPDSPDHTLRSLGLPPTLQGKVHLDEERQEAVQSILALPPDRNVVILGDPGIGKTVVLFEVLDRLMKVGQAGLLATHHIGEEHTGRNIRLFLDDLPKPKNDLIRAVIEERGARGLIVTSRLVDWNQLPASVTKHFDVFFVSPFLDHEMGALVDKVFSLADRELDDDALPTLIEYAMGSPIFVWSLVRDMVNHGVRRLDERYLEANASRGMTPYITRLLERLLKDGAEYREGGLHMLTVLNFLSTQMRDSMAHRTFLGTVSNTMDEHTTRVFGERLGGFNVHLQNSVLNHLSGEGMSYRFPHDCWADILRGGMHRTVFSPDVESIEESFLLTDVYETVKVRSIAPSYEGMRRRYRKRRAQETDNLLQFFEHLVRNFTISELEDGGVDLDWMREVVLAESGRPHADIVRSILDQSAPKKRASIDLQDTFAVPEIHIDTAEAAQAYGQALAAGKLKEKELEERRLLEKLQYEEDRKDLYFIRSKFTKLPPGDSVPTDKDILDANRQDSAVLPDDTDVGEDPFEFHGTSTDGSGSSVADQVRTPDLSSGVTDIVVPPVAEGPGLPGSPGATPPSSEERVARRKEELENLKQTERDRFATLVKDIETGLGELLSRGADALMTLRELEGTLDTTTIPDIRTSLERIKRGGLQKRLAEYARYVLEQVNMAPVRTDLTSRMDALVTTLPSGRTKAVLDQVRECTDLGLLEILAGKVVELEFVLPDLESFRKELDRYRSYRFKVDVSSIETLLSSDQVADLLEDIRGKLDGLGQRYASERTSLVEGFDFFLVEHIDTLDEVGLDRGNVLEEVRSIVSLDTLASAVKEMRSYIAAYPNAVKEWDSLVGELGGTMVEGSDVVVVALRNLEVGLARKYMATIRSHMDRLHILEKEAFRLQKRADALGASFPTNIFPLSHSTVITDSLLRSIMGQLKKIADLLDHREEFMDFSARVQALVVNKEFIRALGLFTPDIVQLPDYYRLRTTVMAAFARTRRLLNTTSIEFVRVPRGEFLMGSDMEKAERPAHITTIKRDFFISKFPVTQAQFTSVMGRNPSRNQGPELPVEDVTWHDAQEFVGRLNRKEGTTKYRLPTEAEWERACRGGQPTEFNFGNDEGHLPFFGWFGSNSRGVPQRVGRLRPNHYDIYDMHGNVWEWVQDEWHDTYRGAPTDGSSWEDPGEKKDRKRVRRGGSCKDNPGNCRSAYRYWATESTNFANLGFRIVRDA